MAKSNAKREFSTIGFLQDGDLTTCKASTNPSKNAWTSTFGYRGDVETERIDKLTRLVKLSLGLNGALIIVNVMMAYLVFAIVLAEPANVAGVTDTELRHTSGSSSDQMDYRVEMRTFFERMSDVLDREARKQGVNPADVVPTQEAIDTAVETRTMHSDESQAVLQKLREGFELFDLAWPIAIPEM